MNKKNTRKGFTIVELVIVIAVIAILATVLVPTFGNVIDKANASKLLQNLKNEYTEYSIEEAGKDGFVSTIYIKMGADQYYKVESGNVELNNEDAPKVYKEDELTAPYTVWDATATPNAATSVTEATNPTT